ncbi:MAG TPA: hypothetical protein EYH06_07700 [Chromatiales bacterium]|nr:hypothetical protein [Thiotrichales bacterium]HIP68461.1 hypothetical protein [Chromatiales bacterium]
MIKVTEKAAAQIRLSAEQGNMQNLPLRLAAQKMPDGSIHYGMGFDDASHPEDQTFSSAGVDIVVAPQSFQLLKGTTLDYAELESGNAEFIFLNPNDPNYVAPQEGD